jgi:hypothetical protein
MKNNKNCKRESQSAHQFNASPIQFILGLCVVLGVSSISVRADDNLAQAAARVALEQKIYELDHSQALLAVPVTHSAAVVKQPGKAAASVTGTVSEKVVTPQIALAPATPVAASAAVASTDVTPAAVAPAAAAPAAAAHHLLIPMLSLLILACFILSLLLLKALRQNSRRYSSN